MSEEMKNGTPGKEETEACGCTRANRQARSRRQQGASLVEYGLLVGLISVFAIGALTVVGQRVSQQFSRVQQQL